jgi:signal transduction histidine kinase
LVGPVSTATAIAWLVAQTLIYGVVVGARGDLEPRWVSLLAFIGFQVFAFYTSWVAHRERQGRLTLARLHAELEAAHHLLEQGSRERERLRIARDLHDVLGHHLTALSLRLEAAHHTTDAARDEHLEASRATVKDLLGEVRTVVSELRELPGIDLRPALERLVDGFAPAARLAGAQIHLDLPRELPAVDGERAHLLVRATQELLTNAARHARAKSIRVALIAADRAVELVVADDGRGARDPTLGHGLRGLRERIEAADGTLELESPRGGGFVARLHLPIGSET